MKVLVAMSGGVDSSVAALLLKEQGYDIAGAYIKTWMDENDVFAECPWERDREDASAVAGLLGIDFEVVNLINEYKANVVNYLVEGYRHGITPNPDIMCNREMKFGIFLDYALKNGFDAIATGHYCRNQVNADGSVDILQGRDENKDQSYFLALVRQEQMRHALFPVGALTKSEVRALAEKYKLPNAGKKDSQGICFLAGKMKINDFLKQYIPDEPGPIVKPNGSIIGRHRGLHRYTIGQRKGIDLPSNTDFKHFVVVAKRMDTNELVVAFDEPDAPGLYTQDWLIRDLHFINKPVTAACTLSAKARYRDPSVKIDFEPLDGNITRVRFHDEQRALAAGQVIAFYSDDILLGGGYYLRPSV